MYQCEFCKRYIPTGNEPHICAGLIDDYLNDVVKLLQDFAPSEADRVKNAQESALYHNCVHAINRIQIIQSKYIKKLYF